MHPRPEQASGRRTRAFTLLEVLMAMALFAMAAVMLASAYLNVLNSYETAGRAAQLNEDFAFARQLVLNEPDRKKVEEGGEFAHGYTYSGHPASCAAALANLSILRDEGLVDRCRTEIGPYLQSRWSELADHPLVGEARGVGMIGALELVADKTSRRFFPKRGAVGTLCRDHCFREGLVMRAVRDTMIISPPLMLGQDHVDELVAKAWRCLDLTLADLKAGAL